MVASMTGYARVSHSIDSGVFTWELRSVNHRFLETTVRMPEHLRMLEIPVRQRLARRFSRGKIDVFLSYQHDPATVTALQVQPAPVAALAQAFDQLQQQLGPIALSATDLLKWPGVLQAHTEWDDALKSSLMESLDGAIDQLAAMRTAEGQGLATFIRERLQAVLSASDIIAQKMPELVSLFLEKLRARFDALALAVDADRLEQEMVFMVQKMDIAEELQRLDGHVKAMEQALSGEKAMGRRLDFLTQEMHREVNTIGSKSANMQISATVVDLKVWVEQIKEQVQNVE